MNDRLRRIKFRRILKMSKSARKVYLSSLFSNAARRESRPKVGFRGGQVGLVENRAPFFGAKSSPFTSSKQYQSSSSRPTFFWTCCLLKVSLRIGWASTSYQAALREAEGKYNFQDWCKVITDHLIRTVSKLEFKADLFLDSLPPKNVLSEFSKIYFWYNGIWNLTFCGAFQSLFDFSRPFSGLFAP